MPDVPRLAWPLRLDTSTGGLAVVEQDSPEDITQCLHAIANTTPGDRPDAPDMGIEDPTFGEQPLDLEDIRETFAQHEPRVTVLATTHADELDQALADIGITWDRGPLNEPEDDPSA